jgi:hypothetical protein
VRRVWVIRGGEETNLVDEFVAAGAIGLHFPDVPDGRSVDRYDVTERLRARGWTNPETRAEVFQQFVHQVVPGHAVLMPDPARRDVVVGLIDGDYEFRYDLDPDDHRHRRPVRWLARHGVDQLPDAHRDLSRQRTTLTERSSPALLAHIDAVERGEIGRDPTHTAPAPRTPRAPRAAGAPRARSTPKATKPAAPTMVTKTCTECFLAKPTELFPGGGAFCVDCA